MKQLKKTRANTEGDSKNTEKRIQLRETDEFLAAKSWQPVLQKEDIYYLILNSSNLQLLAVNAIFVPPKTSLQPLA
ncbi:MAG: hypothetical protein WCI92_11170 [Bacteroidota bacterium]